MGSREYRASHRDIGLTSNFARCRRTRRSRSCGGCGTLGSVEKSLKVWSATSRQMRLILPWRFERPPFSRSSSEESCDWSRSYFYWRFYFCDKNRRLQRANGIYGRRHPGGVTKSYTSFPQNFQILFHFEFEIDFKTYVNEIIFANPGNLAVFSAI